VSSGEHSGPEAHGKLAARVSHDLHEAEERLVPAWLRPTGAENRIPAALAIAAAIVMQFTLPNKLGLRPSWLVPLLELVLLVVLTVLNPVRLSRRSRFGRYAALTIVAIISIDNAISAALLDHAILVGKATSDPTTLIASAASIYFTNVIAFGLWYWELDRGGPFARSEASNPYPDFLFPQMANPELASPDWEPRFLDYLYVSFTNATAFSPTDTMPLTLGVKALMAVQSAIALTTIGLVVAHAVNVLR
jgi:hypothetical protein